MVRNSTPLLPDLARALHRHLLELPSAKRAVGGVIIVPGKQNWHWDESTRSVVLR